MKHSFRTVSAGLLLLIGHANAGPLEPAPIDPQPVSLEEQDEWNLELRPYLWTVSLDGNLGVNGIITPVDLSFGDILSNLDFAAAATFVAERGKWSFLLDVNYLKMSTSIDKVPFPIFDTVGIEVQQLLLGGAAFYRVAEWDRGFLDVGAGVQYMHMKNKLDLAPSSAGIAAVSDQIAEGVVDRVASEIQSQIRGVVTGIISSSPQPPLLPSEGLVRRGQEVIEDTLSESFSARANPRYPRRVANSGLIRNRIGEYVSAAAAARVAGAGSRASVALRKAERNLSRALQREITDRLPRNAELSEGWVDPFVAARARHFLTERLYLNAYGSYGGFGINSDLVWATAVGPGFIVNDWMTLEFFYRYMRVDYKNDGFIFDADMQGLFLGAVVRF